MISLTLPSLHLDPLARTLCNLRDATRGPYQIIVVSPFEPPNIVGRHSEIVWVKEQEPRGCNAAHCVGFAKASGEFIVSWVDDHLLCDGWDIEVLDDFQVRETSKPYLLGLRQVYPEQIGTIFGLYYPYFPFMRRSTAEKLGWFQPDYRTDFADCDVALRVWEDEGVVEWSERGLIAVHPDDQRKGGREVNASDMALFLSRWRKKFGASWHVANLRDFNIDVALNQPEWVDTKVKLGERTARPA